MELLEQYLNKIGIPYDDDMLLKFEKYYDLLLTWNSRINLTSITDRSEVIIKHFIDSAQILRFIDLKGKSVIDVGTGAGFPGIPVKILCPECKVVLLDSLNKRVSFLDEVIRSLNLSDISVICGRAEDYGHDNLYRESFDIGVSRAVASLDTLSEYCLPFVNIDGCFISYKGINISEENQKAEKALSILGGRIDKVEQFVIPGNDIGRSLIFIKKDSHTPDKYPRRAGTPLKKPLQ